MNIILIPIGTAGDVFPFLGIGEEFLRRGHRVTVLTNAHFQTQVEAAGMEFAHLAGQEVYERMADHPMMWHPTRAFRYTSELIFLPAIEVTYRFLEKRYVPGETIVVAASLAWGALIAAERLGIPVVTVHLQPALMGSVAELPVLHGYEWLDRLPYLVKRSLALVGDRSTDRIVAPDINRFRASVGLAPIRRVIRRWTHSPFGVIGLFDDWFAPPQRDWPPRTRLTGFPLYDGGRHQMLPRKVEEFLLAGPPVVLFTAGSGMRQARWIFESAIAACRRLGCRGLIISPYLDQIPETPAGVLAAPFAPFGQVFPHVAAIVQHGGIGTLALALAAGVPQLLMPFAHDHFDNCARVCRLGAGLRLHPSHYQKEPHAPPAPRARARWDRDFLHSLRYLLEHDSFRAQAQEIAKRINGPAALRKTCDEILGFASLP